jgi:hypothetical protein
MLPIIVIEAVAGSYIGYKIYQRVKKSEFLLFGIEQTVV